MSALQWALLIFGVIAVVAVYLASRRDRGLPGESGGSAKLDLPPPAPNPQMDIFANTSGFDEFGVGKVRKIEPDFGAADSDIEPPPMRSSPVFGAPSAAVQTNGKNSPRIAPTSIEPPAEPIAAKRIEPRAERAEKPAEPPGDKIVSLLIAERSGLPIFGDQLHAALRGQKLEFGMHKIYHRIETGQTVFSVASMLKPGVLDPNHGPDFSTPGLAMFMVLPGPKEPNLAVRDMLSTAHALARSLNAEVLDSTRKPLSPAAARGLQAEVEAWAREHARG